VLPHSVGPKKAPQQRPTYTHCRPARAAGAAGGPAAQRSAHPAAARCRRPLQAAIKGARKITKVAQAGKGWGAIVPPCIICLRLPTADSTQQLGSSQMIDESRSPPPIVACVQVTAKVRLPSWWAMRRGCSPRGTVRMCSFYTQQSTDTQRRQQDLVNHRVEADEPPIEVTSGSSS
jgi:hypothetical protein